jgi:hypothetical protein
MRPRPATSGSAPPVLDCGSNQQPGACQSCDQAARGFGVRRPPEHRPIRTSRTNPQHPGILFARYPGARGLTRGAAPAQQDRALEVHRRSLAALPIRAYPAAGVRPRVDEFRGEVVWQLTCRYRVVSCGISRTTSAGSLSSRRPWNRGWRSCPSVVHSLKPTSATRRGWTQCTPARGSLPRSNGDGLAPVQSASHAGCPAFAG